MHSNNDLIRYSGTGYAGPAQIELTRRLFDQRWRVQLWGGTINLSQPTPAQILDAIAYCDDLLPDLYSHWEDPVGVVMLAPTVECCTACEQSVAAYEVPRSPAGWATGLCRVCALTIVGNRRLGLGLAQRLVRPGDIPDEVRELSAAVSAELGRVEP